MLEDGFDDKTPVDSSCAFVPTQICVEYLSTCRLTNIKTNKKIIALHWSAASHGIHFHSEERQDVETNIEISPLRLQNHQTFLFFKHSLSFCGNFAPNFTVTTRRFPGQVRSGIFDQWNSTGSWRYDRAQVPSRQAYLSRRLEVPAARGVQVVGPWGSSWGVGVGKSRASKKRELEHQSLHTKKVKVYNDIM